MQRKLKFKTKVFTALFILAALISVQLFLPFEEDTPVYRSEYLYDQTSIAANDPDASIKNKSHDLYHDAIVLGGEWFLNNQNDEFLHYEYDLAKAEHTDKTHMLREMATSWSIGKLSSYLADDRYRTLARKGFDLFEKNFTFDENDDFYVVNDTPNKMNIGLSAFTILSLLEIDHPRRDEYLEKFANGLLFMQNDSGEFRIYYNSERHAGENFYPGESLVALMALYNYTGDKRYYDAVELAFPHYSAFFTKNPDPAFVPWQSRAYAEFYRLSGEQRIARYVFDMNDFILDEHEPQDNCTKFTFDRGIATAVYLEGMNKAYKVAREHGDLDRVRCYGEYIKAAANFTLSLQVVGNHSLQAIGGFKGSPTSNIMRVDMNQHAVMALMDARDLGILD